MFRIKQNSSTYLYQKKKREAQPPIKITDSCKMFWKIHCLKASRYCLGYGETETHSYTLTFDYFNARAMDCVFTTLVEIKFMKT